MILTLQEELSRLYAAYVRNGGEDPDALSRWPDLNDRSAEAQKLTVDDWRVLHHVFLSVAAAGGEVFENWFVRLSRRFGAADHAVTRTSRKNGLPDNEEAVADEHGVDMWAYDMLLGAAWLVTGASPSGPADLLPEGAARYLTLPPELRTHFTDEMLVVEQLLGAITTLSPEKMDDRTREFLRNGNDEIFFKRVYIDQRDLLLEHDTHWMLLYNAVLNSLWQSELPVHLFRAHLNMTTINEMDSDPKRRHGDLYLGVAKGLLKGHFSRVVQNPERTTFSFMAHSAEDVRDRLTDFDHDISHRLVTSPGVNPEVVTRFTPQVVVSERVISRDNLYEYAIAGEDDLDAFRGVIEFEGDLSVDDLKATVKARGIEVAMEILKKQVPPFSLIRDKGDSVSRKTLDALILQALIRANGLLAAQTSFFERYPAGADNAPLSGGAFSSHAVYQEKQLPQPGDLLYGQWMEMRFKLTGFVGPGEYQPSGNSRLMSLPGPEIPSFQMGDADFPGFSGEGLHPRVGHLLRRIPRIGRWKGHLSHRRAGSRGGLFEQFVAAKRRLVELPEDASASEVTSRLEALHKAAEKLLQGLRAFYSRAITDRHAWTPKKHETFMVQRGDSLREVNANLVLQQAALEGNTHLAALEYDSFKAYQYEYPAVSEDDGDFHRVRDAVFIAARTMKMPDPVVKPAEGDHLIISFAGRDHEGRPVDPVAYCRRIQSLVHDMFQDRPFYDYKKVDMHHLDFRLLGRKFGNRNPDRLIRSLMDRFNLNAEPLIKLVANDRLILDIPNRDRRGRQIDPSEVRHYLERVGLKTEPAGAPTVETKRLAMWRKGGAWYFGAHPPKGYAPFVKTLTVSIALGAHEPVRTEADIDRFAKTEDAVNEALKDIKEKTWPDKGGLASASFDDPMPKNPAPPLSNGSLNGIAGLLVLGLTGFSQPEIGAVQSAVSYDHPVPVSAPFTGNIGSAPLAGLTAFAALPSVWTVGIPLTAAIPYTPSAAFPAFAL